GRMYVYTGLLHFIDNEATLAGVLAHEVTHADHRHATQNMTKVYGLQILAAIALGQNPSVVEQIVADIAGNLTVLRFSRDMEREADKGSFDDLLALSGRPWYPGAVKFFLQKALSQEKSQPGALAKLFLDHPPSQE